MPWRPRTHQIGISVAAQRARYDADRATDPARLARNTARWRTVRRLVLSRRPLCVNPFRQHGEAVVATQVDHILSLRTHPQLAYTYENLQPLCTHCHARKTAMERERRD